MKYVYKALLANTSSDEETKKSVILWDKQLLEILEDGVISYHEFYNVSFCIRWLIFLEIVFAEWDLFGPEEIV